jgi:hypothetical protein
MINQKGAIISLKIINWIFFIPAGYLVLVFIFGVIYTINKDHIDYRFLHENEEAREASEMLPSTISESTNVLSINTLIF